MALQNRLKTRVAFSAAVEIELMDKLKALSVSTRIPLNRLLDEAIADLLKKHQAPEQD
jgi:post-segregation antitoxin (ccd killing protein)